MLIEKNLSEAFDTIEIYPLSDLHIGDPKVDKRLFKDFITAILAEPNRYIICNGDNINNAIKSSISNVYNEEMTPREQKKWLMKELEPVKDRILVMVEGNHEARTSRDVDQSIIEDIADHLGITELVRADEAFIKLTFGKQDTGRRRVYNIYCTHGNGGGKRPGATVNNLELLGLSVDADVYIVGHAHKKLVYKNAIRKVDPYNNLIREEERLFVCSSHWSEFSGYAARKMLLPSAKGSVPITLYSKEKRMTAVI